MFFPLHVFISLMNYSMDLLDMVEEEDLQIMFESYNKKISYSLIKNWIGTSDEEYFLGKISDFLSISEEFLLEGDSTDTVTFNLAFSQRTLKFTLSFWKTFTSLLEFHSGSLSHTESDFIINMFVQATFRFMSFNQEDTAVCKITKFLAASLVKTLKVVGNKKAVTFVLYEINRFNDSSSLQPINHFLENNLSPVLDLSGLVNKDLTTVGYRFHTLRLIKLIRDISFAVLKDIFESLANCSFAISEGYCVRVGERSMSLMHFIILKLSGLCTMVHSSEDLHCLESVLVSGLLSSHILVSLVCSNVFVFLARLAPPIYVTSLITVLSSIIPSGTCPLAITSIKQTIGRLIPIADPDSISCIKSNWKGELLYLSSDPNQRSLLFEETQKRWQGNRVKTNNILEVVSHSTNVLPLVKLFCPLEMTNLKLCRKDKLDNIIVVLRKSLRSISQNWKSYRNQQLLVDLLDTLQLLIESDDVVISSLILDIIANFAPYSFPEPDKCGAIIANILCKMCSGMNEYLSFKGLHSAAQFAKMSPHQHILVTLASDQQVKALLKNFLQVNNCSKGERFSLWYNSDQTFSNSVSISLSYSTENIQEMLSIASPAELLILNSCVNELKKFKSAPSYLKREIERLAIISGS